MTERREYDEATKAAVMAALLAGQSVSSVAKEYNIPKGTVSGWRNQAMNGVAAISTQKREEIGDALLGYLNAAIRTLHLQVEVFGDQDWLKRQEANQLAVLHGVIADKSIRLLEALADNEETGTTG